MSHFPQRIKAAGLGMLVVLALTSVLYLRRGRPRPALPPPPDVPLCELILRDGRMWLQGASNAFTGTAIESYPDGTLQSRSGFVDGVLNGVSEGFFTTGQIQVREHFTNGVSHGLRTKWFASGKRLSEARVEHGKIGGVFRRWHENGVLAEEVFMSNDLPHGVSRAYYPDGRLKAEVRMEQGKVIEQKFWKEGESAVSAPAPTDS